MALLSPDFRLAFPAPKATSSNPEMVRFLGNHFMSFALEDCLLMLSILSNNDADWNLVCHV